MNLIPFCAGVALCLLPLPLLAQDASRGEPSQVLLKYAAFDPALSTVAVPTALHGDKDTNLFIVQFSGQPTDAMRVAVRGTGAELHGYLPDHAHVVRMTHATAVHVQHLPVVRSVSYYHPAFRLEAFLRGERLNGEIKTRRYNIVVVDKQRDKPSLRQRIERIEGRVVDEMAGSLLLQAELTGDQLLQVVRFDEVLWVDRWSAAEFDMDNARIQGGGNYVETAGGYTGKGIIGHQYEGLEATHRDWNLTPIGYPGSCTGASSHGHNTAGIVYGNGTSHPTARGMAPDAQAYFTSCTSNRYANFSVLINTYNIMYTTASWGSARTRNYTSVSAEADDICFDHDLVWTNSQSNAHNQDSRAEAWAKNVMSIGGVRHYDNSNPGDDSWNAGGASIGPAADGRIKPDLCAYYDNIATSAMGGGYTATFGGTSGATPIVAGHNALAIQMFTDGVFGNVLRKPNGSRFENKPHFTTLKALQMANAAQYTFTSSSTDNRREHQGWGFPSLRSMWDNRGVMFIVDEDDVIKQGEGVSYTVAVPSGRAELKVAMTFADPAANPSAQLARINDLTLRVTAPNGTKYWGNQGLEAGNISIAGGDRDRINTTENVIIPSPVAGNWLVEVVAYSVVQDSHVETTAVDADFGLVVNGATLVSKRPITVQVGSIASYGSGCVGTGTLPSYCVSHNPNGGALVRATRTWEYAYRATTTSALTVTGFELWTATVGQSPVNAPVAIYLAAGSAPNNTALATGSMTVGTVEGFHKVTFATPVNIPANATFFVAMTHNNQTFVSTISGGASGPVYYRSTAGWLLSGLATAPSYRVLCAGGAQTTAPVLTVTGTPETGQVLTHTVTLAARSTTSVLFLGVSDKTWSGAGLPLSLASLGAPTCNVLVSLDVTAGITIDGNGRGELKALIPNVPNLVGATGFVQCMVVDPGANNLGLALTNAVKIVVGG